MPEALKQYTARDGTRLWSREWIPPSPKAVVVCVHGIQSHSGWFVNSCEALAERGNAVFSLDRRGSGRNESERGHVGRWQTLTDDIADFFGTVTQPYGSLPRHLVGVSWGGKLAACFAAVRPHTVDSLLFVAPGLVPRVVHTVGEMFRIALAAFLKPRARFRIPIDRPEMFTHTPERIEFIRTDPLMLRECTARFFIESVRMDRFLRRNAARVEVPALLLLAKDDPIIDNESCLKLFQRFGSSRKKIRVFPAVGHTLEFEKDIGFLVGALTAWMERDYLSGAEASSPVS
jgi:alpha-beta hydrolase superfamily lysophospholipase